MVINTNNEVFPSGEVFADSYRWPFMFSKSTQKHFIINRNLGYESSTRLYGFQ